jgi:DNA-binding response OmpR family regulator
VIALGATGLDLEAQTTVNLMKLRADSFIEKPVTFDELLVAAKQLGITLSCNPGA